MVKSSLCLKPLAPPAPWYYYRDHKAAAEQTKANTNATAMIGLAAEYPGAEHVQR